MRGRALLLGALVWALIVSMAPYGAAENAPPEVRINTPDHGSTVSGTVVISGNAWDHDGTILGVKVRIDAGAWWMATDTSGNGTWWSWETSWDTTTVPNGWHGIGAITWDNASQHGDAAIEVYVLNEEPNHAPWVKIVLPPNHSTVRGTVTVHGHSGDADANDAVELVQVKIDAGEWVNATPSADGWGHWTFDWDTTTVDDGWHAFAARAFDGEKYSEVVVFEYLVDNVPNGNGAPVVKILHPENHATVWGIVLVHGRAADPDDGDRVEMVQVRIGDGAWHNATDTSHDDSWSTWAWQWDTTKWDNGERQVCARGTDGDLWSDPTCIVVKVANENHRPTVAITHPKNGQTVSGLVLIHGTAADDHGVKLVEVRFNDGAWSHATDTSPDDSWTTWAYEWDTTKRDDGCLHVSARAWDGSLFSEVYKISVCVDNVNDRPWVKIVRPENNETVHGLYLIHGRAGDDHGVKVVQVRIDDHAWDEATNTGRERPWSTWAYEWNTNDVDNGKHVVCARSFDGAKYSEVVCRQVIVHNDPPIIRGLFGSAPAPLGNATPLAALGLLSGVGVAILMWLRAHGYLRK